eukprot:2459989-Prymnesium_polylepis.1
MLAFFAVNLVLLIALVEQHPIRSLVQPAVMLSVPLLIVLASACRFPDGVPERDAPCVIAFFVLVSAASIHQLLQLWERTEDEFGIVRVVRRTTMVLSAVAVLAHASVVSLRRCKGIWGYSRVGFAFAGGLRLAATGALYSFGMEELCYPPTNLDMTSSVVVNLSYCALAVIFTPTCRRMCFRAFSGGEIATSCSVTPCDVTADAPASALCSICMSAPKDHAFIPCGHICTCAMCAHAIFESAKGCPVCRRAVVDCLKTYLA